MLKGYAVVSGAVLYMYASLAVQLRTRDDEGSLSDNFTW